MFGNIQNAQGEQLDYTYCPGASDCFAIVVIGHGVTGNKDRPWAVALCGALGAAAARSLSGVAGSGAARATARAAGSAQRAAARAAAAACIFFRELPASVRPCVQFHTRTVARYKHTVLGSDGRVPLWRRFLTLGSVEAPWRIL